MSEGETSPDYQAGWRAGHAAAREDLAETLKALTLDGLDRQTAREIFIAVYGVVAAEEDLGPELHDWP